jgi:glycosyltransferase involved in cell wall biosynthesis/GT2 family glycosyltransferase
MEIQLTECLILFFLMRILQIFNRYVERGGEEVFVERASEYLGDNHEVHNLIFDTSEWLNEPLYLKVLQPLRMIYNPQSLRRLAEAVKAFQPDVALVHNLFPVGSLACYKHLQGLGIPVVQYIHNFRPFSVNGYCWADSRICEAGLSQNFMPEIFHASWQNSHIKTACYAFVLWLGHVQGTWGRITKWIAISEFVRQKFISAGIPPEKIHTIRHPGEVSEKIGSSSASLDSPVLLYLGRLSEEKGLKILVAAWKEIERSRSDGTLVIAGDGPLGAWLKRETADCSRVIIEGFVAGQKKSQLISSCSALVVPSIWWEALGLVVHEAYQASKPVLSAASGGLTETVKDGETGWVHPPGDIDVLVRQIGFLLDHPDEAQRRGENGRNWLADQGRLEVWQTRMDNVLQASQSTSRSAGYDQDPASKGESIPTRSSEFNLTNCRGSSFLKPKDVCVVFATMNRKEVAAECVRCLCNQTLKIEKIIVTDNDSKDGTAEALTAICADHEVSLELIRMDENLGNAGGIQLAMDLAFSKGYRAVWVLDDDSWPEPGAFEALLDPSGPPDGIRTSLVLDSHSEKLSWPCEIWSERSGWKFVGNEILTDTDQWIRVRRSWLGALISKEAYDAVGPVNGALFLRGEDEEYPRRLGRAGFQFWMTPSSILRHPIAGELMTLALANSKICLERNLTGNKLYYRVRNMLWLKKQESGYFVAFAVMIGYLFLLLRGSRPLVPALSLFREALADAINDRLGQKSTN